MIHPQLQGKDYEALHPGNPVFLTFDNQAIAYEGESTVYPIFINEAAYYEKGIAMCLTQKQQLTV
jgi:aspartoacylase